MRREERSLSVSVLQCRVTSRLLIYKIRVLWLLSASTRKTIDRKIALREATFAEYGAMTYQSYKAKWKRIHAASVKAVRRNEEFLQFVRETKSKMNAACLQQLQQLSPASKALNEVKRRYELKVDRLRPGWEQKIQQFRMQKLQELDQKKRTVEYRRRLAQKVSISLTCSNSTAFRV